MLKNKIKVLLGMFVFLFAATISAQDQSQTPQDQTQTPQDQTGAVQDESQSPMQHQDEGEFNSQVDRLSSQLNLTEEQSSKINTILSDYQTSVTSEGVTDDARTTAQTEADAAIVEVLDENQRVAYQSMSTEWWNEINTSVDATATHDAQGQDSENEDTEAQQSTDDDQQY